MPVREQRHVPSAWRACALALLLLDANASAQSADAQSADAQSAGPGKAEADAAFAAALMAEGDYYRAISEYKRLTFESATPAERWPWLWQIASAYHASGRYEHAIYTLARLRNDGPPTPLWTEHTALATARSYLGLRLPQVAMPYLDRVAAPALSEPLLLLRAIAELQTDQLAGAEPKLAALSTAQTPAVAPAARRLLLDIDRSRETRVPAPWLAGLLSALVPGAGQVYTGHYVDALQAFAFVSAFAFSSYLAYQYDHDHDNPYLLTTTALAVTGVFHVANVLGAVRTAVYYDQRRHQALIQATERELLALPLAPPARTQTAEGR